MTVAPSRVFIRNPWPPHQVMAELTTAHNVDYGPMRMEVSRGALHVNLRDPQINAAVLQPANMISIEDDVSEPWAGYLATIEQTQSTGEIELSIMDPLAILDSRLAAQGVEYKQPTGPALILRSLVLGANLTNPTNINLASVLGVAPSVEELQVGGQSAFKALQELHNRTNYEFWIEYAATSSWLTMTLRFDFEQGIDASAQLHLYEGINFVEMRPKEDVSQLVAIIEALGDFAAPLPERAAYTTNLPGIAYGVRATPYAAWPSSMRTEHSLIEVMTSSVAELSRRSFRAKWRPLPGQGQYNDVVAISTLTPAQESLVSIGNYWTRHDTYLGEHREIVVRIVGAQPTRDRGIIVFTSEDVVSQ